LRRDIDATHLSNITANGNITANANVTARMTLVVDGTSVLSGNVLTGQSLTAGGNLTVGGTGVIAGNTEVRGNLVVWGNSGQTAFQFFRDANNAWGANGGGALSRVWTRDPLMLDGGGNGGVYTTGSFTVGTGQGGSFGDLSVSRDAVVARNALVRGGLTVIGATNLAGGLNLNGDITVDGNITGNTLTARSDLQVNGVVLQGAAGQNYFVGNETGNPLRVGSVWGIPGIYSEVDSLVLGAASGEVNIGPRGGFQLLRVNGVLRMGDTNVLDSAGNWIGPVISPDRVNIFGGVCPDGQYVNEVRPDGTVACAEAAPPAPACEVGEYGGVCVRFVSAPCVQGSAQQICRDRGGDNRLITYDEFVTITRSGWSRPNGDYHTESVDRYNVCGGGVGQVGVPGWGDLNHFNCGDVQGYCNRSVICVADGGGVGGGGGGGGNCAVGNYGGVCVSHLSEPCVQGSALDYCVSGGHGRLVTFDEFTTVTRNGWSSPNGNYHTEAVDQYNVCGGGVGNVGIPGWGDLSHFNCGDNHGYCNRSIMCVR
jgi:hypothetical protein